MYVEQTKLLAGDGKANDFFGYSVALSEDTVVVGAYKVDYDELGDDVGAAYVYTRFGNTWVQQAKLPPADGEAEHTFGGKVALSGDTAIIGVIRDDDDARFWPEYVSNWHDSGLSQADYCREHELCQNSFSYHKRKYSTGLVPTKGEPSGFVRVQVIPQPQYHEPLIPISSIL